MTTDKALKRSVIFVGCIFFVIWCVVEKNSNTFKLLSFFSTFDVHCEIILIRGGTFLWNVGLLHILGDVIWMRRRFSVSVRKLNLSKFVFAEDVNSRRRAALECHVN